MQTAELLQQGPPTRDPQPPPGRGPVRRASRRASSRGAASSSRRCVPTCPATRCATSTGTSRARFGAPYVKRFVEERELTVMLVVDVVALDALRHRRHGEARAGRRAVRHARLRGDAQQRPRRPGCWPATRSSTSCRRRAGAPTCCACCATCSTPSRSSRGTRLGEAARFVLRTTHRRSVVFWISDFEDRARAARLAGAVRAGTISPPSSLRDPRDEALPPVGWVELEDLETGARRAGRHRAAAALRDAISAAGARATAAGRARADAGALPRGRAAHRPLLPAGADALLRRKRRRRRGRAMSTPPLISRAGGPAVLALALAAACRAAGAPLRRVALHADIRGDAESSPDRRARRASSLSRLVVLPRAQHGDWLTPTSRRKLHLGRARSRASPHRGRVPSGMDRPRWSRRDVQVFALGSADLPGIRFVLPDVGEAEHALPVVHLTVTPTPGAGRQQRRTSGRCAVRSAAPWWERVPWRWVAARRLLLAMLIALLRVAPAPATARRPAAPRGGTSATIRWRRRSRIWPRCARSGCRRNSAASRARVPAHAQSCGASSRRIAGHARPGRHQRASWCGWLEPQHPTRDDVRAGSTGCSASGIASSSRVRPASLERGRARRGGGREPGYAAPSVRRTGRAGGGLMRWDMPWALLAAAGAAAR